MEKQKLLKDATEYFKQKYGVSHTDLGFNFVKIYKNSVLFAKSNNNIENFEKSDSVATKAIVLIGLFSLLVICSALFFVENEKDITDSPIFICTAILLYIVLAIVNFYLFRLSKHYESLYKNDIIIYKAD